MPPEIQTAVVNSSIKAESTYSINDFAVMHPTTNEDVHVV